MSDETHLVEKPTHTWLDETSERPACIGIMPEGEPMVEAASKIPLEHLVQSEIGLEELIRDNHKEGKFDKTLGITKILFWDEYDRAVSFKDEMNMENVWKPLVSYNWWNAQILNNPLHLAWLLTPPAEEALVRKEMLLLGMSKLREAIDLPLREKVKTSVMENGKRKTVLIWRTNVPLIREIHSIVKTMQDRVHGTLTQKHHVEKKSLSINVNTDKDGVEIPTLGPNHSLNMDELDKAMEKLNAIETKMLDIAKSDGEVIDVGNEDDLEI